MKAVILVGGEGTRLRPLTMSRPKPLMPVANRPFIEHVLANLGKHGVDEAILTTGYMAEAFEGFPPERTHGVKLTVVREETLLGSAGAARNVESFLDGPFLVCNGDILTDVDFSALIAFHESRSAAITIHVTPVEDPTPFGLVPTDADGRVEAFVEKPGPDQIVTNLINAGTWLVQPEVMERVPAGRWYSFERDLFPALVAEGAPVYAFRSPVYWLGMDTPERYLQANHDVLEALAGVAPPGRDTPTGAWVEEGARIDPAARIRGPAAIGARSRVEIGAIVHPRSCIGADCHIGPDAVVEESVLHDGVEIGDGVTVQRSVVASGAKIGPRTRLVDAVIGAGVDIGTDNELRGGIRIWPGLRIPDASIRF